MDEKTLQYMGKRVDKARELQKRIDHLKGRLAMVGKGFQRISIAYDSTSIYMSDFNTKVETMSYITLTEAYMINVYFDMTKAKIKVLEQELSEL